MKECSPFFITNSTPVRLSVRFLRQWTSKRHPLWRDPKCLLQAASKLKITRSMLEKLREEFRLTLLKEQLAGANGGEWLCRYGPGSEAEVRPGR